MGRDAQRTAAEIEQTREELALKVDELMDRAKVEATEMGRKLGVAGGVLAGVLVLGWLAKRRVQR